MPFSKAINKANILVRVIRGAIVYLLSSTSKSKQAKYLYIKSPTTQTNLKLLFHPKFACKLHARKRFRRPKRKHHHHRCRYWAKSPSPLCWPMIKYLPSDTGKFDSYLEAHLKKERRWGGVRHRQRCHQQFIVSANTPHSATTHIRHAPSREYLRSSWPQNAPVEPAS